MKKKLLRVWRIILWHIHYKIRYELVISKLGTLLCYPVLVSFKFTWKEKFLSSTTIREFHEWATSDVDRIADTIRDTLFPTKEGRRRQFEGISLAEIRLRRECREHEHVANEYNWEQNHKEDGIR